MKSFFLSSAFFLISHFAFSQITDADQKRIVNTTSQQKTANSKDILSTFFRASVDKLLGEDREFTFNSTFYGIDSIFRNHGSELKNYKKERMLRQVSFNLGLAGDSNNTITKISSGFTFTPINNKDIKLKKIQAVDKDALTNSAVLLADMLKAVISLVTAKHPLVPLKTITDSWSNADRSDDFSKVDPMITEALNDPALVKNILAVPGSKFTKEDVELTILSLLQGKNPLRTLFKAVAEKYSRKALWTVSPNASYDRINKQGEYSIASEFTVGLSKDLAKKPWEVEIKSSFKLTNDTTVKKTNYDSKPLSISLGVNKVLLQNEDEESKMEFKLFTQYEHQFGNVLLGNQRGVFSFNTTFRINVFRSLWLPLTIKYDVENSNFLGFLALTANLGN